MSPRKGVGSQRNARRERMTEAIVKFVSENPGSSAQSIVGHLSADLGMRNHGLTPRKVGFFIPRFCPQLTWYQDHKAGRRVYTHSNSNLAMRQARDITTYAEHRTGSHTPHPQVGISHLSGRACQARREMAGSRAAKMAKSQLPRFNSTKVEG